MTRPIPTPLYHITRIDCLESIVARGLRSDNELTRLGQAGAEIGFQHIKARRRDGRISCRPGRTVGDYVPFYFAPRSPMLYTISAGNVGSRAANVDEIVYLESTIQDVRAADLDVLCTDRNAALNYAQFIADDTLLDDDSFVDWPVMAQRMWNNTPDDPDRMERRQAECLVYPQVGWELFHALTVRTPASARRVRTLLDDLGWQTPVTVRRDWYF